MRRFASRPSAASLAAVSRPKNSTRVGTPRALLPPVRRWPPDRCQGSERRCRRSAGGDSRRSRQARRRDHRRRGRAVRGSSPRTGVHARPRSRIAREVRVLREDLARFDELRKLNEPAARARMHVQRIELFHRPERIRRQQALTRRRHPEVDERQLEVSSTETARLSASASSIAKGPHVLTVVPRAVRATPRLDRQRRAERLEPCRLTAWCSRHPFSAQVAGTSEPPSSETRGPNRTNAGCDAIFPATRASPMWNDVASWSNAGGANESVSAT